MAFAHRIFGVGHTFSNVSELLSSARAMKAPATTYHFRVGDADGIFAEYGTRSDGHPARTRCDRTVPLRREELHCQFHQ